MWPKNGVEWSNSHIHRDLYNNHMKLEVNKDKLLKAISRADKITGKNTSLSVLSCIVLETKESKLEIKSTNLELGISLLIPAKVMKEGIVAIPANIFVSYINNLGTDENLVLEKNDNILMVTGKKSETKINTLPTEDFPPIPKVGDEKSCKIASTELVGGLKSVWYAASLSSMKPELSSVYVYPNDGDLTFVATDSFRLAEKKTGVRIDDFESILIPQRNVSEIIRIFDGLEDEVKISFGDNQASFEIEGVIYLVSRVVDGSFPDYKQIIPKEDKTEVTVLKNDLFNTLKISNLFSDNFNQVNFKINSESDIFETTSKNSEKGETRNTIPSTIRGESIDINFNQKYINDSFSSIVPESIVLKFNGSGKPVVIRGVGDKSFMYLVMPLNK